MRSSGTWSWRGRASGIVVALLLLSIMQPVHGQTLPSAYSLANFWSWLPGAAAQTNPLSNPPAAAPPAQNTQPAPPPLPPANNTAVTANAGKAVPEKLSYANCLNDARGASPPDGDEKLQITPAVATRWQPIGGMVRFTITGTDLAPGNFEAVACVGWDAKDASQQTWQWGVPLQVLGIKDNSTEKEITLGAVLPNGLGTSGARHPHHEGLGMVPIANLRVLAHGAGASSTWHTFDASVPVGVTQRGSAVLIAVGFIGIAWWIILRLAKVRPTIRGGPLLRLIANRNGYASLSQLQITLWTFVIAAGAVYVMALSGALIDIPTQALTLLGISGVAVVGAALPGANASSGPPPAESSATTPGMVSTFGTVGRANATSVVLNWRPPPGGKPPASYTIEQMVGTQWRAVAGTADLCFPITGLAAGSDYQFRVTAVDATGTSGAASQTLSITTAPAALGAPPAAPTNVVAVTPDDDKGEGQVRVTWTAPAPPTDGYLVRYRAPTDTTWTTIGPIFAANRVITDLRQGTSYEFQVAAIGNGAIGNWSDVATAATRRHNPRYADLIIWDGRNEVDVTRIQMLLFTVIAAVFVLLQIWRDNAIPDIPQGILVLMGISNGVYLTAKFIPPQR